MAPHTQLCPLKACFGPFFKQDTSHPFEAFGGQGLPWPGPAGLSWGTGLSSGGTEVLVCPEGPVCPGGARGSSLGLTGAELDPKERAPTLPCRPHGEGKTETHASVRPRRPIPLHSRGHTGWASGLLSYRQRGQPGVRPLPARALTAAVGAGLIRRPLLLLTPPRV